MKYKLYLKVISLMLTLTLLVGIVTPTVAAADEINADANSRGVNVDALSDQLLSVLDADNEEHIKQLEITDVEFDMERDFDQTAYVTVKNTGADDVEFFLDITNDYDDIFLGFVGAGSPDQPTLVTAGSSVQVKLTVFAQKVGKNKYNLPVKSYIVDGTNYILDTETEVILNFEEAELNFACDLISTNTDTLEQNFMLTNMGDTLNCVSVTADIDLSKYAVLNPTVSDTPVKNNESINITVTPNYTALKEDNVSLVKGNLVVNAAGKQQRFAVTIDTEGKEIYSITMGELVAYQKGQKEYYNLTADVSAVTDTVEITDKSTDDNIDYKINFSVPYIDKNTNKEITRLESSYTAESYTGDDKKTGDMLVNKYYQDGDDIIYEYKMFISIDDLKEFIATLDEDFYNVVNQDNTASKLTSKLTVIPSGRSFGNIAQSGDYWEDVNGSWGADIGGVLIGGTSKVGSVVGNGYTIVGGVKGAYDWATGKNHEKEKAVLDSPNLTDAEKREYSDLCNQQDQKGVGVAVTSLLVGFAFSGGVGIAVGLGIVLIDHLDRARMERRKAELEAKAGIGDGVGGDGGQSTTDNKRNQCTNAGKIEGDFNNPYQFPQTSSGFPVTPTTPTIPTTPSGGGGDNPTTPTIPTTPSGGGGDDPTTPTAPTGDTPTSPTSETPTPTSPTDATKPTIPTAPTTPTDPTSSTDDPTTPSEEPTGSNNHPVGLDSRFVLLMDKNTVNTNQTIKAWIATNGNVTDTDNLEFKLQYKIENYPIWSDHSEYTDYPVWHIEFDDAYTYEVRCLIRDKNTKALSYVKANDVYVTDTCLNGYFNRTSPSIFVTSRLAAGDQAANDDNMTTEYYINGKSAGKITNNGHAQLSMATIDATSGNVKNGTNAMLAKYSTTPTHYRTVSDMQIITYYPPDTVVNFIGDIEYYPDVTLHPDFTVFEENIYTDSEFYVNEETTLHCKVYNRNAAGGWVDIVVKDGDEVIYTETNTWMGMFSEKTLDIPWTPKTRESAITVELTNKCTVTKEADLTNNKVERNMKANEYIEPSFGETDNSLALEGRDFSVYTHILDYQNVTNVACYIDDEELILSNANYTSSIKYWSTVKGLSVGNHKLKYIVTYDKAGNATGTLEKIIDINVISKESSSTIIAKNDTAPHTSAIVYRNNIKYATYTPDTDGFITIMYNADMYSNRNNYKLAVYNANGVYVTSLTAGNISVDNTKVQDTFKVSINSGYIKLANLYVKNSDKNYYQQISYNRLDNGGEQVYYLSEENYALYNNCDNAYMVLVRNNNVVHKLQLIENSKRVETLAKAIKLNESNLFSPVKSASASLLASVETKATNTQLSKAASASSAKKNLVSNWAYAYSSSATMNIQKLGTILEDKNVTSGNMSTLSADTYDVYYTLKSDNCIFDIRKEISISDSNVTNKISNSFTGKVNSTENEVNPGENISLSFSDLLDENGNELTEISSLQNEFTVTVTFTDVNDSSNIHLREIKAKNLQDALSEVKAPEEFGDYQISLSLTIDTYSDIVMGDVNGNDSLELIDVIIGLRYIVELDGLNDKQIKSADMDMSNSVTLRDIIMIQKKILDVV